MENTFKFSWEYKDFEIRTSQETMGQKPTVELVQWQADHKYCIVVAIYHWDNEGGELRFVGNRPFEQIAEMDLQPIWKQLWLACAMLQDWYKKERDAT